MSDEVETTEEEEKSIWEILEMDDPNEEEKYSEEEDEAEASAAKADKMERKLTSKMEEMQTKLERTIIRERIKKFEESADDLQKELFKALAADVKDVESLDKAMGLVDSRAKKMKEQEEEYRKKIEEQTAQQVAQAWGTGPVGTPSPRTKDEEAEALKKIAAGDTHELFKELMTDNWPSV